MDTFDVVASTAEAAFATNQKGAIVAWNKAAAQMLGYEASQVLGKLCHPVICGTDVFGNRFCVKNCALAIMGRRREGVRDFEMDVRTATSEIIRTRISIVVVPRQVPSKIAMIHLLKPLELEKETRNSTSGFLSYGTATALPSSDASNHEPLTAREIQVLRLLADGASTKEIGTLLFISVTTVRNHIQNILGRLKVHSRLEAVSLAHRNRLI